ncbi:DUF3078 domain-containing protein [Cognataquiflexum rubidum]|uniref:DUF3078 domain-containing protein n=1 Tax=Cognataquiflexum rubidum TaxID=2922273 RepID=UPI001F135273|nr:DUF3078 domain-containing protein [Cognataquiflexum rubidum]MCH6234444.1 DUF3078 domain-containing protein [Cognataquiflexum rubidum]
MKKLFTICLIFTFGHFGFSQDADAVVDSATIALKDTTYWISELSIGFNLNQASFSGNWKSGGVNSFALGSIFSGKANYAKDRLSWDNQVELIYGIVKNDDLGLRKSNDRIFFDSKVGYKINQKWGYFTSLNFITQFTDGFDYSADDPVLISRFFAPAFLTTGFGFEYKPNADFALRLAPFSPRFTFVTDLDLINTVPDNYGVPAGQKLRTEWLAFQVFMTYNKKFSDNLTLNSRYQIFANLQTLEFKTIDHRLDFTLIAKITRYVDVTFTSINVYDIDMVEGIQFSQALALGILYKVNNKK